MDILIISKLLTILNLKKSSHYLSIINILNEVSKYIEIINSSFYHIEKTKKWDRYLFKRG